MLTLGSHTFDVRHRAVVVARLSTGHAAEAEAAVRAGAEAVQAVVAEPAALGPVLEELARAVDVPVLVDVPDVDGARAAIAAGAVAVLPAGQAAAAADLPADHVVLLAPAAGAPGLVDADDDAAVALAITLGARLVRSSRVRSARRVADVLAAVLEARR